ncbi:Inhibitor of the KinA pathway to sporulation, Putative exonuclease [Minicystis rosea]|nr:Inhibitor of the KinA pathway to sporulation, Putative exonuclease [Minicystis rosea]
MSRTTHYLVIDLEATCDERTPEKGAGDVPPNEMEIIEIGAVLVDERSLEPEAEFQTFIQPVRHPILTPFCTQLTSITQDDVANARGFREAIADLERFIDGRDALFCSWGAYDLRQFEQDARFHHVELPFRGRHLNLKKRFSFEQNDTTRYGMASALARVGLPLEGTHHRGIDDARNIARLLPWCLGRRPFPELREPRHPPAREPSKGKKPARGGVRG